MQLKLHLPFFGPLALDASYLALQGFIILPMKEVDYLAKRAETLAKLAGELRDQLTGHDPEVIAERCGLFYDEANAAIRLPVFNHACEVSVPSYAISCTGISLRLPMWLQAMVLKHLVVAKGGPVSGSWVSLREIPDGRNYADAMQGYAADRLAKHVANDIDSLARSCELLGGAKLNFGDLSYSFSAFPRLLVAIVYWLGDDEFPPAAKVLFDVSGSNYMSTDGLAILGNWLCSMLIEGMDTGRVDSAFLANPYGDFES